MSLPIIAPGVEAAAVISQYAQFEHVPAEGIEFVVGIAPDGAVDITWTSEPNRRETAFSEPNNVTAINLRGLLLAAKEGHIR